MREEERSNQSVCSLKTASTASFHADVRLNVDDVAHSKATLNQHGGNYTVLGVVGYLQTLSVTLSTTLTTTLTVQCSGLLVTSRLCQYTLVLLFQLMKKGL